MNQKNHQEKRSIFCKINSFVIASFFSVSVLYEAFLNIKVTSGLSTIYIILVSILGIANLLFYGKAKLNKKRIKKYLLFELILGMAYALTVFFAPVTTTMTLTKFLMWVVLPAFFVTLDYDVELILRYSMYVSLLSVFEIRSLLADQSISIRFAQTSLGIIYDLLPCLVAAIFHFFYYRKKASLLTIGCYVYYALVLLMMLPVIVRGALLSLILGLVIIFLNRPNNKVNLIREWSSRKKVMVFLIALAGVAFVLNYEKILVWAYEVLQARGINFGVITKFYVYIQAGNVSDGRDVYYDIAIQNFIKSPIWGNGIETFYAYPRDGVPYPHNYLLQFLFEGGILLAVPIAYQVFRILWSLFLAKIENMNTMVLLACLSVVAVIPGLFSMDVWLVPSFWMAIMCLIQLDTRALKHEDKGERYV